MASLVPYRDKSGVIKSYNMRVFLGNDSNGKQIIHQKTLQVNPKWSDKRKLEYAKKEAYEFEKISKEEALEKAVSPPLLFRDYAEYVLGLIKASRKPKTVAGYVYCLKRINEEMGDLPLTDITTAVLNAFFCKIQSEGENAKTEGKLSSKTIHAHKNCLSRIFRTAISEGKLTKNPLADVIMPKKVTHAINFYYPEEYLAILNAVDDFAAKSVVGIKWQAIVNILLYLGCRLGELCGLKWSDISFSAHTIRVQRGVVYTKETGLIIEDYTKNYKDRIVRLPNVIFDLLERYREWQNDYIDKNKKKYINQGFVFTQINGQPMNPSALKNFFERLNIKYPDLPHLNAHAFRHTCVSILIDKGATLTEVAHHIGDTVDVVAKTYAHLFDLRGDKNLVLLDEAITNQRK